MKKEIDVPEYRREQGLKLEWEYGFSIECNIEGNVVVIKANREGLISLARHCLTLAQQGVPLGSHLHLDESNALKDGSSELILARRE